LITIITITITITITIGIAITISILVKLEVGKIQVEFKLIIEKKLPTQEKSICFCDYNSKQRNIFVGITVSVTEKSFYLISSQLLSLISITVSIRITIGKASKLQSRNPALLLILANNAS